jgi:biofilm PGA synthesis lipoprotein PgaB
MLKRVTAAKADTVYLAATLDHDDDGLADAALFANSVLPVQADILSQAAGLLHDRGIRVFITMPVLGIRPAGRSPDMRLLVAEYRAGRPQPSPSGSKRLSPFNPKARILIEQLYADLAANVTFDGVVFGPDAYLSPTEDFSAPAAAVLRSRLDFLERDPNRFTADQRQRWNAIKTATLEDLLASLRAPIAALHPNALFVRCLQGPVVSTPDGGGLFAQDYQLALRHNDLVWVNATPEAYQPGDVDRWLIDLAADVTANPQDAARTTLAVGLWNPQQHTWISDSEWSRRVNLLIDHHVSQISYFPDGESQRAGPHPRRAAAAANAIRQTH